MAADAYIETPVPAVVQAIRDFLKAASAPLPEGEVRNAILATLPKTKNVPIDRGVPALLKALGTLIESEQPDWAQDSNRALIARLKGDDGVNISDIMADLTIAAENELPLLTVQLREALMVPSIDKRVRSTTIFEQIERAFFEIEHKKRRPEKDTGPEQPKKKSSPTGNRDSWRDKIVGNRPPTDDEAIHENAHMYDPDFGPDFDMEEYARKAAEDENSYVDLDDDDDAEERDERIRIAARAPDGSPPCEPEPEEIDAYKALAQTMAKAYKDKLEPQLKPKQSAAVPFP